MTTFIYKPGGGGGGGGGGGVRTCMGMYFMTGSVL